jgi:uncharacterized membrane protein YcaP (DUF421 family)
MEIVFRAAFIFIFLWIVTRAVGRAQLGELSTFQLMLYVTMGDLVQQGITQQDYSVTGSLLAVSTFALLTIVISWLAWRYKHLRPMIDGMPIIVMRDGDPVIEAMAQERMTMEELRAQAREQGIRNLHEVDLAVLETDGKVSFFTQSGEGEGAPEPQPAGG